MVLQDYAFWLRKLWWLVAGCAAAGVAAAVVLTTLSSPTYSARATLMVDVGGESNASELQAGNVYGMQVAATYAGLAQTSSVTDRAAQALGGGTTAADVLGAVNVSARTETALIDFNGGGGSPTEVADRVNALADALVATVLDMSTENQASPVSLKVVERAEVPRVAVTPRPQSNVVVGFVLGTAIGLALVVGFATVDDRIHRLDDVAKRSPFRLTASLQSGRRRGAASKLRRLELQRLRSQLEHLAPGPQMIVVAESAADGRFGRELARSFSEIAPSVLHIDLAVEGGDRRPDDPESLTLRGLLELLPTGAAVSRFPAPAADEGGFASIGPGARPDRVNEELTTLDGRAVLARTSERFSTVVVSVPPVATSPLATTIGPQASLVVLHADRGVTRLQDLHMSVRLLNSVGSDCLALVLE